MRWTLKPPPEEHLQNRLAKDLNIDPVLSGLLVQRGIDSFEKAKSFFRPSLKELYDPFLMTDMQEAVDRIQKAVDRKENILVYGDYDVDGTTSVALVSTFLGSFYPNVSSYIPDRYSEGYGVSYTGIDYASDNNISLIIALDCGVKAIDKVDYAKEKGIDFIIGDHHRPDKKLPAAVAVLDPKREDCNYPFDELCGCGVGFKLCQAYTIAQGWNFDILIPYLDLVATAIGADIVPMIDENRILAYHGLHVLNTSPRPGFQAIISQLNKTKLTSTDVVFTIAPRINAAGRMKHGLFAVELLTANTIELAVQLAQEIEQNNTDRKETDQWITKAALEQIINLKEENRFTTVVYDPTWHKGVIGIVASRLIETYYRPTIVFTKSGDKLAASVRSVRGFDVYDALSQCSEFIEQYGGHKYAAGLTLKEENYDRFKERFEEVVCGTIHTQNRSEEITVDLQLPLSAISPKFYRILKQMEPYGPGNMTPVFLTNKVYDTGYAKQVGSEKTHLKACITDRPKSPLKYNAIGFNLGDQLELISNNQPFDIVYSLDENTWNNVTSLQLRLRDIH